MYLGIDIGGTNVKFGVIDEDYSIVKKTSIPTNAKRTSDDVLSDITAKAKELCGEFDIEAVGMGCPGRVDQENGICISAGNLPFRNTPVAQTVGDALGKRTALANDAKCAVFGELHAGVGRDYNNFAIMMLGTGVGGGVVINKKILRGLHDGAGEFGHLIVDVNGRKCSCGQYGCLEHYASVTALIEQTKDAVEKNPDSLLARMCAEKVSGKSAFEAKRQGCPVAAAVVDRYISYIAVGATNVFRVLQPEVLVIGGAISNEGDEIIVPLRSKISPRCPVTASMLKNDAGIVGAVAMLRNGF